MSLSSSLDLAKDKFIKLFSLGHTIEVINNPQANLLDFIVLLGTVIIVVLILLAVVLLFLPGKPGTRKEKLGPRQVLTSFSIFILILSSFFALLAVGFSVATTQQRFCNLCHSVHKQYKVAKVSGHPLTSPRTGLNIDCRSCHQKPGLFNFLLFSVERFDDVRVYSIKRTASLLNAVAKSESGSLRETTVDNVTCLKCHENIVGKTVTASNIRVRHSDFLKTGERCLACHKIEHRDKDATPETPPAKAVMNVCLRCHDNKKVAGECKLCHVKDAGTIAKRDSERIYPTVEVKKLENCRGCHPVKICIDCHGIELPHPPNWAKGDVLHAREAAFDRKQLCLRCHDETLFCNRCHNFPNGHVGTDWKILHRVAGKDAGERCRSCHNKASDPKDFCKRCHK